jgi:uncharacterized protein
VEEPVRFEAGPGVEIEGSIARVEAPRGALVVCHPHPLYGGDMDNPVVTRAAEVAREIGIATLRFNFRGVGRSSGTHGGGPAERDDVVAALGHLRSAVPERTPIGLAGYSFGALVSAGVAEHDHGLSALCLIAPPIARSGFSLPPLAGVELLVVAGTRDEHCPPSELGGLAAQLPASAVIRIENADHFFFGKLHPLGEAIRSWALRWIRP